MHVIIYAQMSFTWLKILSTAFECLKNVSFGTKIRSAAVFKRKMLQKHPQAPYGYYMYITYLCISPMHVHHT